MFHLRFGLSDHLKALLDFVFGSRRRVKKVRIFRAWFSHIDVSGSLATNWVELAPAGVTLSAHQTRFAWQAWYFLHHHRCQRKLGDALGRIGAVAFYAADVSLSAHQARFAWQAWHFRCQRKLGDELGRIGAAFYMAGVALSAHQARFACHFLHHHRCQRKLGDDLGRIGAVAFYVAGVTLSAHQARFAWQAWYFLHHHRCQRKLGDELGRIDAVALRGRRDAFSTSGSSYVAGVSLSAPS